MDVVESNPAELPAELMEKNCSSCEPSQPAVGVRRPLGLLHFATMLAGIVLALIISGTAGMGTAWGKLRSVASLQTSPAPTLEISFADLNREEPQTQAEMLLEQAVAQSRDANRVDSDQAVAKRINAEIESRVDSWRGQLKWDAQLGELTTVALNSRDRSVRDSAVEVQLAACGLSKSESSVDSLIRTVSDGTSDSPAERFHKARRTTGSDHARKVWALWSLGLLANRGIETDRIVGVLSNQLKQPENAGNQKPEGNSADQASGENSSGSISEDTHHWAVESLALIGTTPTIAPLLGALHDDPSPMVRERAASSLAASGMFSRPQRLIAVPQLINDLGDSALDAQTRDWAFQALTDITRQRLPNNFSAWQNWYQKNSTND